MGSDHGFTPLFKTHRHLDIHGLGFGPKPYLLPPAPIDDSRIVSSPAAMSTPGSTSVI
jgi:hypothetical protein